MRKLANVAPILKKGNKQLIQNYRPISLLPVRGNILETIVFRQSLHLSSHEQSSNQNQSGFRLCDSTTNQLLYLLDEINQAFDSTKSFEVRTVFLDISTAFDKVWHDGLIFKLEQNGISGNLQDYYLSNRKQRVVLNGSYSDYSSIQSGVFLVLSYFLFISMIWKEI